jgi:hypothetical protein
MAQAAGKYGEMAPTATICCNVCRTCVQTNGIALVLGGMVALGATAKRGAGRFARTVS